MGDEDEAPADGLVFTDQSGNCPKLTGKVIDQTMSVAPERSSTTPGYRPASTPPDDPNARNVSDIDLCGRE